MLFTSLEFTVFLPIVFLLYWFVFNRNVKVQNLFILVASYIFYGWWDWRFLFLIVFTSLCSYSCGVIIEKYRETPRKAKLVSALNIIVNLLILWVFKYYDFFVTSFANAFLGGKTEGLLLKLVLPVGISFYTFKALSYSIDVYRRKLEPTRDIVQFLAFVAFFPELLAGPIDRATDLLPQFAKSRTFKYEEGVDGLRQILWGLFKKVVIADQCAAFADQVFASHQTHSGSTLLIAAVLYTFQIYGDFSGYSDIAIGTSKLFGIKIMQNFKMPYFSRGIAEFWRRWHISLTSWFRDYIYFPMGGSRCSKARIVLNTFVVFLASGLWHGANWTFIAWGAYHALLFLPLIMLGRNRKYRDTIAEDHILPNWKECGQMLLTFILVMLGWIMFKSDSISQAFEYCQGMLQWGTLRASYRLFTQPEVRGCTFAILAMLIVEWWNRRESHGLALSKVKSAFVRIAIYFALVVAVLCSYGSNQSFIYFQF